MEQERINHTIASGAITYNPQEARNGSLRKTSWHKEQSEDWADTAKGLLARATPKGKCYDQRQVGERSKKCTGWHVKNATPGAELKKRHRKDAEQYKPAGKPNQ